MDFDNRSYCDGVNMIQSLSIIKYNLLFDVKRLIQFLFAA